MQNHKQFNILNAITNLLGLYPEVKVNALIKPEDAEELELTRIQRTHHIQHSGWFKFKRIVEMFDKTSIHADRVNIGTPDNPEELYLVRGDYYTVVGFIEKHGLDKVAKIEVDKSIDYTY